MTTPPQVAFWVMQQCVRKSEGYLGGFITKDFKNITDIIMDPTTNIFDPLWRKANQSTSCLDVSI